MLSWLSQNKEWLFSGIGVSVCLLIGGLFLRVFRRPTSVTPSPTPTSSAPRNDGYSDKPTPTEIREQIEALPPFQQGAAITAYRGLKVRWPAIFKGIHRDRPSEKTEKKWMLVLEYDNGKSYGGATIFCQNFDVEQYPRLKFAHAGSRVYVRGTILSASAYLIFYLDDVSIEFND